MNEMLPGTDAPSAAPAVQITLDGRRPERLDGRDRPLVIARGHADVFLIPASGEARRHLLRAEAGDLIPPLPAWPDGASRIVAVGVPGTVADEPALADALPEDGVEAWILRVSALIVGLHPAWEMREILEASQRLEPGERRRGPARAVRWVAVVAGAARPMGCGPDAEAGGPSVPLAAGLWLEAGIRGCMVAQADPPTGRALRQALDRFHSCVFAGLARAEAERLAAERRRLARRSQINAARASDLFERLAGVVVRRPAARLPPRDGGDALIAACDLVAATLPARLARPAGRARHPEAPEDPFAEVLAVARASRLRVRRTLLRGSWWRADQGALVAWHGESAHPVALLPDRRGYVMIDPSAGHRRRVDQALATEIGPEAVTFYATLPARVLRLRDLLAFAAGPARGNLARIALAALMMAALALVVPLITEVLVNSAVPRSQLDQVAVCAAALAVAAIASAAIQASQNLAMLRLEGLIDWTLQAALIDRMLRLRTELFRDHTAGDLVSRVMGVDAVRRVLTGQALRKLLAGLSCPISIGLMVYYDARLALVGLGLAVLRGLVVAVAAAFRLRHERRHFDVQGREAGFILQLFAGIPKLRVANATTRALAVWSEVFAAQKTHHVAAQRVANRLAVVESAFPTLATLVIFAAAMRFGSSLTTDLGAFLAFFAAFGQAMAQIGAWASAVGEVLVAVPHVTRMRPLLAAEPEVAEDRKPAGDLAGAVELSRVTFRYGASGPPVLDDVSLRVAPGEYVAIVGPSGGGKSSLFRLLLGFERPEAGAVFYDDKALDTLDVSTLRRQLGVVLQNGRLTTGSLYENICGGVPLPMEQALEAARLAGLEADIQALPMGLHTMVAEGVNTFSGGQRQRLLIARAIARRPRILLLDEATSALDNASQAVVSASLGALNVTRIVIAHRLSTVREADRIVVLVNGRIVQSGSFAELSATPGVFAQFAERQLV